MTPPKILLCDDPWPRHSRSSALLSAMLAGNMGSVFSGPVPYVVGVQAALPDDPERVKKSEEKRARQLARRLADIERTKKQQGKA